MEIVRPWDYIKEYLPDNPTEEDYEKIPSKESLNIYALPNYEFIDHNAIMREFTGNITDDKQVRKVLFNTLRYDDNMDKFYDCLKEHGLYEEFRDYSSSYYDFVFREWCCKYDIKLRK